MIVAFTGHRPNKFGGYSTNNRIRARVVVAVTKWLEERMVATELHCLTGMAQGFDQWATYACLDLGIPYTAVIPFSGQESLWPPPSQKFYRYLVDNAKAVENLRPAGLAHCDASFALQKRNEWMVDHCDLLLAAWDGSGGGTANCVKYAEKVGRPVERLIW
jgi:uncharacterized phage-like protein YoqJ